MIKLVRRQYYSYVVTHKQRNKGFVSLRLATSAEKADNSKEARDLFLIPGEDQPYAV